MNISDYVGIVGTLFGAVSTFIAIWEAKKNRTLKQYLKIEAMGDYHRASITLGCAQLCLEALQRGEIMVGVQEAGKAQGAAQTIFSKSIENIQHHWHYTFQDIDDWIKKDKVFEHHRVDFNKYAES
ncbi:hypothetical protein [Geomesophilobacter sediminis]|uniref:Uncharacterized protein n=1 Tax=Geomesophilobacter sediminis TaxID=2798584 RepID=A0A8J7LVF1_9BACT|nr:hypothetical protein [Geomesophilobacter sediminis]MBJ6724945.1 hypothetical protein [Geomesophilobacter sediminis]